MRKVLFPYNPLNSSNPRYAAGTHRPARQPSTNHENILLARLALIPIILLVDAVKLQKLVVILQTGPLAGSASVWAIVPAKRGSFALRSSFRVNFSAVSVVIITDMLRLLMISLPLISLHVKPLSSR